MAADGPDVVPLETLPAPAPIPTPTMGKVIPREKLPESNDKRKSIWETFSFKKAFALSNRHVAAMGTT